MFNKVIVAEDFDSISITALSDVLTNAIKIVQEYLDKKMNLKIINFLLLFHLKLL